MAQVQRVLDVEPVRSLAAYLAAGGGRGLELAAEAEPEALVDVVEAAGLRGRGGAGFPTAVKWRTVAANRSSGVPVAVIVNAAEGEPGTFKDRAILRANPYRVLEGALIAARAVGATEVVVGVKSSFTQEAALVRHAMHELHSLGLHDVAFRVVEGPAAYLFGEESAMLEVVEGREPFPRVTPPYRRGLEPGTGDGAGAASEAAGPVRGPALVDNVETLANVPGIVVEGPAWFRSVGTDESPGTIVCTVTGATERHGVGEFAMGTPLGEVIEVLGGGAAPQRRIVGAMSGTANAVLPVDRFDTPLTYEAMRAAGSGLGTAGFIVFDDADDPVAVAHAVAWFLAVESCGQCLPCKDDGLGIARHLDAVRSGTGDADDVSAVRARLGTVANGARCALAGQHQTAVASLLDVASASGYLDGRLAGGREASERYRLAPILDLVDGRAVLDEAQWRKQPDWSTDAVDSGAFPAERYGEGAAPHESV